MGTKRYTVTEKWKDPFFENLSNDYKLVWLFLNDDCDNAGILRLTMKRLNYSCNTSITEKDLLETFKNKVVKLPEGLFFLIDFNTTQYGTEWIDSNNKAVISAKKKLIEIGLIIDDELRLPIDYKDSIDSPSIDYESTIDSTKDKGKVESKAEAKAKEEDQYMVEVKDIDDTKVKNLGDKWIQTLNQ
jgi:hypothetical protein